MNRPKVQIILYVLRNTKQNLVYLVYRDSNKKQEDIRMQG